MPPISPVSVTLERSNQWVIHSFGFGWNLTGLLWLFVLAKKGHVSARVSYSVFMHSKMIVTLLSEISIIDVIGFMNAAVVGSYLVMRYNNSSMKTL